MKLFSEINLTKKPFLDMQDSIATIGSCFSENFFEHLRSLDIPAMSNPAGIIYNPISIANTLQKIAKKYIFSEKDFFLHENLYKSFQLHGSFNHHCLQQAIIQANLSFQNFYQHLKISKSLIITLSSAVVYSHSKQIVANCHRIPNQQFSHYLLSFNDTLNAINLAVESALQINPNLNIIFTISPIRHYPGNLQLNSASKATLRAAIAATNYLYFPAYEILIDELRDYRFYQDDLLHPSVIAQQIIFNKFFLSFYNDTHLLPKRLKEAKQRAHRPRS
ncbi:MAG: GSCFA domain-containing protein [Lentisphaeria bacterium]